MGARLAMQKKIYYIDPMTRALRIELKSALYRITVPCHTPQSH